MIRSLRGVAVLAHPYTIGNDEVISQFVQLGLRGIEVYYSEQNSPAAGHYRSLAQQYGLLLSGGSDCHGEDREKALLGEVKLPYKLVEAFKREWEVARSG